MHKTCRRLNLSPAKQQKSGEEKIEPRPRWKYKYTSCRLLFKGTQKKKKKKTEIIGNAERYLCKSERTEVMETYSIINEKRGHNVRERERRGREGGREGRLVGVYLVFTLSKRLKRTANMRWRNDSRRVSQREPNRAQLAICPPPRDHERDLTKNLSSLPFFCSTFWGGFWGEDRSEVDRMPTDSVGNPLRFPHEISTK